MGRSSLCFCVTMVALAPASLTAQSDRLLMPGVTFAVNGGRFFVGGEDFEGTDNAWGLEGYAGIRTSIALEVSLGVHYSSHGVTPTRDLNILGVYLELRKYFVLNESRFVPLLGGRAGWVRRDAGTLGSTELASAGYGFGIVGGSILKVSGLVQLEALATANLLSFSPIIGESRDNGNTVGLQVGVRFLVLRREH